MSSEPATGGERATAIIIYDGSCGFCAAVVHWCERHLGLRGSLIAWPSQATSLPGISEEEARGAMWFVAGDERYRGAAAFAQWFAGGGRAARVASKILLMPGGRAIAGWVYEEVAQRRHRIPGPWSGSCPVPDTTRELPR